ncbi:MAG: SLC13 family permease [Actinobacteria bacterium]|nr:SLC13 family permease [Actinomycetota bacterium]
MSPIAVTLAILVVAVIAFVSNRVPLAVAALGVSILLWATGVLTMEEAIAGFGDSTVLFIASLFVVSHSLEVTGITSWAGNKVISQGGRNRAVLITAISLLVAALSALISINGAVAALVPVVVVVAVGAGMAPSKLMMPLAFAATAGSLLMLTGSPVNILVSNAAAAGGGRPFGLFEFAIAGVPALVGTILIVILFGDRLLPHREVRSLPPDLSAHARTLQEQYDLPDDAKLLDIRKGVAELVIPPRSELIGLHVFPGMTTAEGNLVVLGLQRAGQDLTGPQSTLQAGDTLLVRGTWEQLEKQIRSPDVVVIDDPRQLRRAIPMGRGSKRALTILAALILTLAVTPAPPAMVGVIAAVALVATGVLTPDQAYRSISWTTVILIAGMMPLSTAFIKTGTADLIAQLVIGAGAGSSPYIALGVLCLMTAVLGQLISNTATILIMLPIGLSLAADLQVSPLPFLMGLAVAGAAAFLTPVATPANTMVMDPGGYRFGDYWKLGLPLLLLFLVVAVFWVPLWWPFQP